MVCKAEQLLSAIVDSEDRGLEHAESCIVCRTSASKSECPAATSLAMESVYALLEAKVYLDQAQRGSSRAGCRSPGRVTSSSAGQ